MPKTIFPRPGVWGAWPGRGDFQIALRRVSGVPETWRFARCYLESAALILPVEGTTEEAEGKSGPLATGKPPSVPLEGAAPPVPVASVAGV